jgi:hypothetical protein
MVGENTNHREKNISRTRGVAIEKAQTFLSKTRKNHEI